MILGLDLRGAGGSDVRSGAWYLTSDDPCRDDDVRIFVLSQASTSGSDRGRGGPAFLRLRGRRAWSVDVCAPGVAGTPRQIPRHSVCQRRVCRSYRRGLTVNGTRIVLPFCSSQSCWSVLAKVCNDALTTHLGSDSPLRERFSLFIMAARPTI